MQKFKKGDIVLRGKHGTIPHKVTGYASANIVTLTSCDTGKPCQSHQDNIRLQRVKAEPPKPTPSYEVDWKDAPEWATVHCFNESGDGFFIKNENVIARGDGCWSPCNGWEKSKFTLSNDLDWKQSLTTRPEQPKPEPTIDEQIEAARAELERLEKIKEREVAIPLNWFSNDDTRPVFKGVGFAPNGLETRCLMFKTSDIELRTQQHNEYTVLTFHRK
jgi:hypothetical protein